MRGSWPPKADVLQLPGNLVPAAKPAFALDGFIQAGFTQLYLAFGCYSSELEPVPSLRLPLLELLRCCTINLWM